MADGIAKIIGMTVMDAREYLKARPPRMNLVVDMEDDRPRRRPPVKLSQQGRPVYVTVKDGAITSVNGMA